MKIGVYGGTFDPPHEGHVTAAADAVARLGLDKLLILPAGIPPHKALQAESAPAEQRLEMARLAFGALPRTEISDLEIRRPGRSYTVDTLRVLKAEYPGAEFVLLVGTDMLLTLDTWRESETVLSLAEIAAFCRTAQDMAVLEEKASVLRRDFAARVTLLPHTAVDISSSALRASLKERRGAVYIGNEVYAYIIKRGIYGAKPDFEWLRSQAYTMLKPSRIPHVRGCEEEAVRLARRWGADEACAREAAILHDITKKCDLDEQLLLCEKYGIIIENAKEKEKKLFHALTGAAIARYEFHMPEPVYSAIRWHTTGKEDMTLLEKVIYMADYIEPNRDFDGVAELRTLAYTDLDAAMILGLQMSIEDLLAKGITPDVMSQRAMEWLIAAGKGNHRKGI